MSLNNENQAPLPQNIDSKRPLSAIGVSIVLAAGKAVAGILGNSFALIADAIESIGDIFTTCIMFIGLKTAARPPDKNHLYGHGKAGSIFTNPESHDRTQC
ncbi:MAG: cation transporter [Balneolales bacterium]